MDPNENLPSSVAATVPFYHFACLCEKISSTRGTDKKKELFTSFLSRWRETHSKLYGNNVVKDSFFVPLRFLLPRLDNERLSYGMKEVFLAKYYIDVLNISKESEDGKMLLNYRTPNLAKKDAGDFASVAYIALKNRCPEKGNLSMQDLDASLESIAQANAEKQRDVIKKVLSKVIRNTSSLEQKWMIRIMLKDMKLGLNENSILPIFHPDALELYNVSNSISKVCLDLHDINSKLNEIEIQLCTPFRPMLGQRTTLAEVEKLMNYEEFIIETKIDGERMQLHKDGDVYHYFSRNSIEYTKQFGATKYQGTLTPFIADCFNPTIRACILDGEMVAYDGDNFVLKGSNVDVKAENLNGLQPCFVPFDILMINNENFANLALQDRIKKLHDAFYVSKGRIQHVERKIARSKDDVIDALNIAIDKREEGIVIKDPNSIYKPSKRKGSGWLKLKPEYLEGVGDDLDLLIVGGLYGSGHRGGKISHFIVAVSIQTDSPSKQPSLFMTFGRVGSGYTDKELKSILDKLDPFWKKFEASNPPKSILFTDGFKEKPDVWIEPENSMIVQIKAAEITTSGKYKTGCTMRFPRLERIRDDKYWYECMTYNELEELQKMADGKLSYKLADSEMSPSKKKRVVMRVERPRMVADHIRSADLSEIVEVSKLFLNKEFCIVNGPIYFRKQEIEKKIAEFGGTIVQNPTDRTTCVIADKVNLRVKSIMNRGNIDIAHVSWLIKCLADQIVTPFKHNDLLFASDKTKAELQMKYDRYGDSYIDDIDEEKLRSIFNNIKDIHAYVTPHDVAEYGNRYFQDSSFSLFRGCNLFVCPSLSDISNLDFISLEFRLHGGSVSDYFDNSTTHILASGDEASDRLETIMDIIRTREFKLDIISPRWIIDCLEKNEKLDEKAYPVIFTSK